MPDDVQVMARCLSTPLSPDFPTRLNTDNCGTAMRFLTAYFAQKEDADVILDGCTRMHERPIGQEIKALRELGADISYIQNEGYPPLRIRGTKLKRVPVRIDAPQSTQFISALLLIGADVQTNAQSPYLTMTQAIVAVTPLHKKSDWQVDIERDWSSAAFFYEHVALQPTGTSVFFPGLQRSKLQGDCACIDIFARLGVDTTEEAGGIRICRAREAEPQPYIDFTHVPDLYPAVAVTCHLLRLHPHWTLPESLHWKESDRIEAIRSNLALTDSATGSQPILPTYNDHRIAMAFAAAGYPIAEEECISKSFPDFMKQLKQ